MGVTTHLSRTDPHSKDALLLLDLPPLRDTSTSSLQYYQQREEDALLAPELVTPSPIISRNPHTIRTNTTATSPTRPFEDPSQSFRQFNQDEEEIVPDNSPHLEASNNLAGQEIMDDQANLNISHDDTSHPIDQRLPHIHGGRAMGSDESL